MSDRAQSPLQASWQPEARAFPDREQLAAHALSAEHAQVEQLRLGPLVCHSQQFSLRSV
jgi:hypothetical protein